MFLRGKYKRAAKDDRARTQRIKTGVEGLFGGAAGGLETFLPFFFTSLAFRAFVGFAEGNVFSPAEIFSGNRD
jgi:hypothetical protein